MKKLILLFAFALTIYSLQAQRHMTRNGHIWFYSHTPIEDIEAHNNQVNSVIDIATGDMAFAVLMKGFQFEKALMQEHFNEKYVESSKFPKATFKGKITNADQIDFGTDGTYPAKVKGDLTIHGVTKSVETEGEIKVTGGKISATSLFQVAVADYDIKIPGVVRDNIAKVIDIHVEMAYNPL